jgi:hypothetical protein
MGCDIHAFVEQKDKDGYWEFAGELDIRRNYTLFAALANVRNGWGFAGCDLGDPITPIAKPRGLPKDVTAPMQAESDSWYGDGHSHSYVSFREILEYPWDSPMVVRGYVGEEGFIQYLAEGRPDGYSGGVGGWNVVIITNEEMKKLVKQSSDILPVNEKGEEAIIQYSEARVEYVKELCDKYNYNNEIIRPQYPYAIVPIDCNRPPAFYTQVEWTQTIREDISDEFFGLIRDALGDSDPDDVRLVFFFDN